MNKGELHSTVSLPGNQINQPQNFQLGQKVISLIDDRSLCSNRTLPHGTDTCAAFSPFSHKSHALWGLPGLSVIFNQVRGFGL
jgi:hypothetical protein